MPATTTAAPLGFIGLGTMGTPMALNLCRAGAPLTVWNRAAEKCVPLAAAGASVAGSPADVFAQCPIVILMLANGDMVAVVQAIAQRERAAR